MPPPEKETELLITDIADLLVVGLQSGYNQDTIRIRSGYNQDTGDRSGYRG